MRLVRVLGLALVAPLFAACESAPTSPMPAVDALANIVPDPTNPGRLTYTFDELEESCGPLITTAGLYEDLVFPSPANLSRCLTANGTIGLMPSALATGSVEIVVQLPRDGFAASVESFLFRPGEAPTLIAYDANGAEIGRASDGTEGVWATLAIDVGVPTIRQLGLLMPQNVVFLDNLTVTYALPPDPEPTDPATREDCNDDGWEAFGFRNHGQCVRFVGTGEDDR